MNGLRFFARVLKYAANFGSLVFLALSANALFSLSTGLGFGLRDGGKYFEIFFPFLQISMSGDNNWRYLTFEFLIPMMLYAVFFFLASQVFNMFVQPKIFTAFGATQLRRFSIANLVAPGIYAVIAAMFVGVGFESLLLVVVHFFLGVFAYFLAVIFEQGLNLQEQQDLII